MSGILTLAIIYVCAFLWVAYIPAWDWIERHWIKPALARRLVTKYGMRNDAAVEIVERVWSK